VKTFRIAFTYDFGSFAAIQALLMSHNIEVLDIAIGGHLAIAGVDQGYYVEVLPDDQSRARQILRDNNLAKYILTDDR